jgi:hypothetical protein
MPGRPRTSIRVGIKHSPGIVATVALSLLLQASPSAATVALAPRMAHAVSSAPPPAQGPIVNLPSAAFTDGVLDGSDFPASGTLTIDLANAITGDWATTDGAGQGVYDPAIWSVVFKYSAVTVPAGKTVNFTNHPSHAPVVWLVDQDVTIAAGAVVDVSARDAAIWIEPGPGGFRGAGQQTTRPNGAGFGPGGGFDGGQGRYAVSGSGPQGTSYGSPGVFPLIGGSGAGKNSSGGIARGGAGGGAILLAANGTISLGGTVRADMPYLSIIDAYYSSGGAIRIVGSTVSALPGHALRALGHDGVLAETAGRIRVEAATLNGLISANPPASFGVPSPLLPDPMSTPSVRVASVTFNAQTLPVPADPRSRLDPMNADVVLAGAGAATVRVVGQFVNPGQPVHVRVTDAYGSAVVYTGTLVGTFANTIADVSVQIPEGLCAVQARAVL